MNLLHFNNLSLLVDVPYRMSSSIRGPMPPENECTAPGPYSRYRGLRHFRLLPQKEFKVTGQPFLPTRNYNQTPCMRTATFMPSVAIIIPYVMGESSEIRSF